MESKAEYQRLCWRSRRGMLELDLVLTPFVRERLPLLDAAGRDSYRRLLEYEDRELCAWFFDRITPQDKDIAAIVARILDSARPAD
ncbi:MAG: succinate dehydrogenase assembly factor 2 [Halieaceae bacterium]|nr:succinate dehydrogenase assembly factor 2 [Halieaceae bacterium]